MLSWRLLILLKPEILLFNGFVNISVEYNEKLRQWKKTNKQGDMSRFAPDVFGSTPMICTYCGILKDDKPTGYGTLHITPPDHSYWTSYRGQWKDGRYHGKGELITVFSSHSHEYSGRFKEGLKHGYGSESWLGGKYKGLYKNGEMCGTPTQW